MSIAILAFAIDCAVGDPRSKFHPVCLIGNLIAACERLLYRASDEDTTKLVKGAFLMGLVLWICYHLSAGILLAVDKVGSPALSASVQALLLSFVISPRNLKEAGQEIQEALLAGDLDEARKKVGWIVGRDTDRLSVDEVTRATVETISENIVDGIISPLFYFMLGGVPLAVAYRAANTMDSMLGYKNKKYLYFGRAAARFDDAWNFIPARLTGILLVAAAWLLRFDWKGAWRVMCRDAKKHPSPNGGYTESTVAGALGIRLGGLNYYFGRPSFRAYMGDAQNALGPVHIAQATRMMYTVTVMFLVLGTAVLWLGGNRL